MFDFFAFNFGSFDEFLSEYYRLALIAAVVLYAIHRARPYSAAKMSRKDFEPPEKIIGSFSPGQLLKFILQTLTFPFLMMTFLRLIRLYGYDFSYLFPFAFALWLFLPNLIEKYIDGI